MWNHLLLDYDDEIVVEFFNYGWPINYKSHQLQQSTQRRFYQTPGGYGFELSSLFFCEQRYFIVCVS